MIRLPTDLLPTIFDFAPQGLCNMLGTSKALSSQENQNALIKNPNERISALLRDTLSMPKKQRKLGSIRGYELFKKAQDSTTKIDISFLAGLTHTTLKSIVSRFPCVQELTISSNKQISDLSSLQKLSHLQKLDAANCSISGTNAFLLPKSIKSLNFSGNSWKDTDIVSIGRAKLSLEELFISCSYGVISIEPLEKMHSLQKLSLNSCSLVQVLMKHPKLRVLDISNCFKLTDAVLIESIAQMPMLEELFLKGNTKITEVAIQTIQQQKPNLIIHRESP